MHRALAVFISDTVPIDVEPKRLRLSTSSHGEFRPRSYLSLSQAHGIQA